MSRAGMTVSAIVLLGGPALHIGGNVFFKCASAKYYPSVSPGGLWTTGTARAVCAGRRGRLGAGHRHLGDPLVPCGPMDLPVLEAQVLLV
jgi:hypothetical protein